MKVEELISLASPGDIGLTRNLGSGLGDAICSLEELEDCSPAFFGHLVIFDKDDGPEFVNRGGIYESVWTIRRSHVSKYAGCRFLLIRNYGMTPEKFFRGREEVFDNLGQPYPAHRLVVQAADILLYSIVRKFGKEIKRNFFSNYLPADWPVCSELGKQFCDAAGVDTGIHKDGWKGVNPADFDLARKEQPDKWATIAYTTLEA